MSELVELSRQLKQEKLFIGAERDQLMALHSAVVRSAEQLYHKAWIARHQKSALDRLVLASGNSTPADCCLKVCASGVARNLVLGGRKRVRDLFAEL